MTHLKLFARLAGLVVQRKNIEGLDGDDAFKGGLLELVDAKEELLVSRLPKGGGFNGTTELDRDASNESLLVIHTEYQPMSEHGYYDGWCTFRVEIRASLARGYTIKAVAVGKESNRLATRYDLRDYVAECFANDLDQEIPDGDMYNELMGT